MFFYSRIPIIITVSLLLVVGIFLAVRFEMHKKDPASDLGLISNSELRVSEAPIPTPPIDLGGSDKKVAPAKKENVAAAGTLPAVNCMGAATRLLCFRTFYQGLVKNKEVADALADIKARYSDSFIKSQCHQLMHAIGNVASEKYPTITDAFLHGDPFCWSGYYHGVMETVVAAIPPHQLAKKIDVACASISGKERYSFDYYNCVHGLGHGVMSAYHNDLPRSLTMCDNLSGGWEQSSCWSGAFMENVIANEINHTAGYLKDDDPLYPCDFVADKYRNTCYLMQTSRMLTVLGGDFNKVFAGCRTVESTYQDTCFQSLGRDASGRSVSNAEQTKNTCMLGGNTNEQKNCIIGAVKDFISYFHSDVQAKALCASLAANLKEICYSTTASYYTLF